MARGYVNSGQSIPYVNPGADIASGSVIPMTTMVAIAFGDIPAGGSGEVAVTGHWNLPKANGVAIGYGEQLYWDAANKVLNKTNTNTPAGKAAAPAGETDAEVGILLNC